MGYVKPETFVLDKDKKQIPLTDKKTGEVIPGKFQKWYPGSSEYHGVEDKLGKDADSYLGKILEGLANFLVANKQALKTSGGKAATAFTIKHLIVASHSGGGRAMKTFVSSLGSSNKAALRECWCFDCLYGGAKFWFDRGATAAPFYAYYFD